MYACKILTDSIAPNGHRLTTMEVTFPRIVLAEFNTHRMFSRNSASSRAIPVAKMLQQIKDDPFIPIHWGKNQKGMQADTELTTLEQSAAGKVWLETRDKVVELATQLLDIGVHKQITNRLLEPFMWQTVIVSATAWANFFALRTHKDAQPEIRRIAELMQDAYNKSEPTPVSLGDYHLPLVDVSVDLKDIHKSQLLDVCVGRCARVSYLTHAGVRDPLADIALAQRLRHSGHMSPFEHVATPMQTDGWSGNFRGWLQYRKTITNEAVYVPDEDALE